MESYFGTSRYKRVELYEEILDIYKENVNKKSMILTMLTELGCHCGTIMILVNTLYKIHEAIKLGLFLNHNHKRQISEDVNFPSTVE